MISVREEARGDTQAFPNQWKTLHPRSSLWDSSLSCADGLGTLISKMFAAIKMVMTWKNILKDLRRPRVLSIVYFPLLRMLVGRGESCMVTVRTYSMQFSIKKQSYIYVILDI